MSEPLVIRYESEQRARALARELAALGEVDVRVNGHGWEVSLDSVGGDRLVTQVLDSVRVTLTGEPSASATVLLDGHEYWMQGEQER